jgi:hypothetical protein
MVWVYPRLFQWGGRGYFTCSNDFYLPLRKERGGGQHPVVVARRVKDHEMEMSSAGILEQSMLGTE